MNVGKYVIETVIEPFEKVLLCLLKVLYSKNASLTCCKADVVSFFDFSHIDIDQMIVMI